MKKIVFLLCAFAAILSNPVRSRADGTLPVTGHDAFVDHVLFDGLDLT